MSLCVTVSKQKGGEARLWWVLARSRRSFSTRPEKLWLSAFEVQCFLLLFYFYSEPRALDTAERQAGLRRAFIPGAGALTQRRFQLPRGALRRSACLCSAAPLSCPHSSDPAARVCSRNRAVLVLAVPSAEAPPRAVPRRDAPPVLRAFEARFSSQSFCPRLSVSVPSLHLLTAMLTAVRRVLPRCGKEWVDTMNPRRWVFRRARIAWSAGCGA